MGKKLEREKDTKFLDMGVVNTYNIDSKNNHNNSNSNENKNNDNQNLDLISLLWEIAESSGYDMGREHYHAALEAFVYQKKDRCILLSLNEMCSRGLSPSYATLKYLAKQMSEEGGIRRIDMMYNDLLKMKEAADTELVQIQKELEQQQYEQHQLLQEQQEQREEKKEAEGRMKERANNVREEKESDNIMENNDKIVESTP